MPQSSEPPVEWGKNPFEEKETTPVAVVVVVKEKEVVPEIITPEPTKEPEPIAKKVKKDPATGKPVLTEEDYIWAASELDCDVAAIKAVASVESAGSGFQRQPDGSVAPLILFEKHIFGKLTQYKYNKTHPHISSKSWQPGTYGPSNRQHARLEEAAQLDRNAALKSCSWGKFQLMGCEWKENGYPSLQAFINAMYRSERDHLEGFVSFIKRKPRLKPALQRLDWATFAYYYNGPGYKKNRYDLKMAQAYQKFKRG